MVSLSLRGAEGNEAISVDITAGFDISISIFGFV